MIRLEEIGSLENLASLIKIIQVIIGNDDILIVVSDTEKVIEYFQGGSFQLPGEVGMKLDKRWGISKAMQKRIDNYYNARDCIWYYIPFYMHTNHG